MQNKFTKILSSIIIFIILYSNCVFTFSYAIDEFLSVNQLENQKTSTQSRNINFDVYFEDGTHSKEIDITNDKTILNMDIDINDSTYLKDIIVDFSDSNFNLINEKDSSINEIDQEERKIIFNNILGSKKVNNKFKLSIYKIDEVSTEYFYKDNKIKLSAKAIDEKGYEKTINKEIIIHTEWKYTDLTAKLEYKTNKYIPIELEGKKELIVEGLLKSGLENNLMPIKESEITIEIPKIENEYPKEVEVVAISTMATNLNSKINEFNINNYIYDKEKGKLTIKVVNDQVNNQVKWNKYNNVYDEFRIIYKYSSNVYDLSKNKNEVLKFNLKSNINVFSKNVYNAIAMTVEEKNFNKKVGELIEFNNINYDIYIPKGYLYSNLNTVEEEKKKERDYYLGYNINVTDINVGDSIEIIQNIDKIKLKNNEELLTTVNGKNTTYNKLISIEKNVFDNVLGNNGEIKVYKKDNSLIGTINSTSPIVNNKYSLDISSLNLNEIIIKTSKILKASNIEIYLVKAFNKNNDLKNEDIQNMSSILTEFIGKVKKGEKEVLSETINNNIKLKEPEHEFDLLINKSLLSTIIKNENIELKVVLNNFNDEDKLYENPIIKIELPKEVQEVNIKNSEIIFSNDFKIDNIKIEENSMGNKVIIAKILGKQISYSNHLAKGSMLNLIMDLTLDRFSVSKESKIKVEVEDGDILSKEIKINLVAPTGLILRNSVSGLKGNQIMDSIDGQDKIIYVPVNEKAKEVAYNMNVINNYDNSIDDVKILGRIPHKNNYDSDNQNELGSTFDIGLNSEIKLQGLKDYIIYYSDKALATIDLNNKNNNWKTKIENYNLVKSYLIVSKEKLNKGQNIEFSYNAKIPENLKYNNISYENFTVYFNNISSGIAHDKMKSSKVGVATGEKTNIKLNLESNFKNNSVIKKGEHIYFNLNVNNLSALDINNSYIIVKLPIGAGYIPENKDDKYEILKYEDGNENLKIELPEIKSKNNLNKKIEIYLSSNSDDKEVNFEAILKYKKEEIKSNSYRYSIEIKNFYSEANFKAIKNGKTNSICTDRDDFKYSLELNGLQDFSNINLKINIPQELKVKSFRVFKRDTRIPIKDKDKLSIDELLRAKKGNDITETLEIKNRNNNYEVDLGTSLKTDAIYVEIDGKIEFVNNNEYYKEIIINGTLKANDTNFENIDESIIEINKVGIKIRQTSNFPVDNTIGVGENFKFIFEIENLSNITIYSLKLTDILPKEIKLEEVNVKKLNKNEEFSYKYDENNNPYVQFLLEEKDKITIEFLCTAKSLKEDTKIINKGILSAEGLEKIESNELNYTIKHFEKEDIVLPDTNDKERRRIVGTVWEDIDKNGIKDKEEKRLSGVEVLLLDNVKGQIAVDYQGNKAIVKTNKDGMYIFNNVVEGYYTVIFLYDVSNYSSTQFHKDGVNETINSDAIDNLIEYEGVERIAAVTEEIYVSKENIYDIDLGLIENYKFDMSLKKLVNSISVNDSKKTVKHEYNIDFAKIDFVDKYVAKSTMVVEYKIIVKNEGKIPGYVKKIADYIPNNLEFKSELNVDWYLGKEGAIYNNSLSNTLIKPGESKEVKLILIKKMNSEDLGIITNKAEIYETSNDYGMLDIDSIEGNKSNKEDDYSEANVLTTIKTGDIIVYTTLSLTVILIIGIGIYIIKKKVL